MVDARGQPRLPNEAVVRSLLAGDAAAHQFDDANRVQMEVEDLVELPHPADAEARENLVLTIERMLEVFSQEIGDRPPAIRARLEFRIDFRPAMDAAEGHRCDDCR